MMMLVRFALEWAEMMICKIATLRVLRSFHSTPNDCARDDKTRKISGTTH